jgi:hypothetical protein
LTLQEITIFPEEFLALEKGAICPALHDAIYASSF